MNQKVAKALLSQKDTHARRQLIFKDSAILLLLLLAHGYFSNLESPLKLIPQTLTAIFMGYMVLSIIALRRFRDVAEFIDWEKVLEVADPVFPDSANDENNR